ncbi:hypothetical protein RND81_02G180700 [Saponaria officinalis]|uniref:Uncharacterized protein n=1 Tax=Saponaria officinalis TaxID=3572 RepID=A0AAW1MR93_SAPOF
MLVDLATPCRCLLCHRLSPCVLSPSSPPASIRHLRRVYTIIIFRFLRHFSLIFFFRSLLALPPCRSSRSYSLDFKLADDHNGDFLIRRPLYLLSFDLESLFYAVCGFGNEIWCCTPSLGRALSSTRTRGTGSRV